MYEREVFDCGAWRSIYELEEWLTLDELFELYDSSLEKHHRLMRAMAAVWGSDIGDYKSVLDSEPQGNVVYDGADLAMLPIGIGYDKVE